MLKCLESSPAKLFISLLSADSAKQTSRLVTIVTPVAVVVGLLLVAIVVVVLVMGVVYSKRKRAQAYSFHRVTFDTANEEDGEEG